MTVINTENFTRFGVITGAQGIKGELKVAVKTDTPTHYYSVKQVTLANKNNEILNCSVESVRYIQAKNRFVIRLNEVTDRNHAELLKGYDVLVHDSVLPVPEKNEVYVHRLIGCEMIGDDGINYGKVTGYFENGAHGILEVEYDDKEILIPLTDEIVTEYRVAEKKILFKPVDGLIELNFN